MKDFDKLLKSPSQKHFNAVHATSLEVIKVIVNFLDQTPDVRLLDLGAGNGKFCLFVDALSTIQVTGVEDSPILWEEIQGLSRSYPKNSVKWIQGSLFDVDFDGFNAFYFFNSFYEQKVNHGTSVRGKSFDLKNYESFNKKLIAKLSLVDIGTLFITYQGVLEGTDQVFEKIESAFEGDLIFWKRI